MFTRPADTPEAFSGFLNELSARTMRGGEPSREEILYLLETPPDSPQSELMRKKAQEMAIELTGNTGRVWSAVGIDRRSCPMNCEFCSFGEKWGLIKDESEWPDEDVVKTARLSVSGGVSWFTLRTTEFYSVERLMALARKVRAEVPGDYALVVNTGELDAEKARQLKDAGVTGVYHTLRLGEGETTRFEPATRLATMSAVCDSDLELYHMVEPLGPEHGNEEIADRLIASRDCKAALSGVMARVNIKGTPFGDKEPVSESRVSQLVAVSRICGGSSTRDICVVPPTKRSLQSGANVVTIEIGSVPRSELTEHGTAWNGFGLKEALELLQSAGYTVNRLE